MNQDIIDKIEAKVNPIEWIEELNNLAKNNKNHLDVIDAINKVDIKYFSRIFCLACPLVSFRKDGKPINIVCELIERHSVTDEIYRKNSSLFVDSGNLPKIHFFLKGPLSQWHKESFVVDDVTYPTAEHYMMAQKALWFDDQNSYDAIIACKTPREAQALGRQVKNFHQEIWDDIKVFLVYEGNLAKFRQCEVARNALFATEGHYLAEVNPTDAIWGIALSEENAKNTPVEKWLGQNWLGKILTHVRETLKDEFK